jgi:hypothetical protein
MPISQSEREFMQRLGEYKRASHAEAAAQHRALPLAERLRRSWALYVASRAEANATSEGDDPAGFCQLAHSRGLYRS